MTKTYGAGISRPKPLGWKPKNKISKEDKEWIISLNKHCFPKYSFAKISRITGISDNCVRNIVRAYLGKE